MHSDEPLEDPLYLFVKDLLRSRPASEAFLEYVDSQNIKERGFFERASAKLQQLYEDILNARGETCLQEEEHPPKMGTKLKQQLDSLLTNRKRQPAIDCLSTDLESIELYVRSQAANGS